jgi:hypothetical protein
VCVGANARESSDCVADPRPARQASTLSLPRRLTRTFAGLARRSVRQEPAFTEGTRTSSTRGLPNWHVLQRVRRPAARSVGCPAGTGLTPPGPFLFASPRTGHCSVTPVPTGVATRWRGTIVSARKSVGCDVTGKIQPETGHRAPKDAARILLGQGHACHRSSGPDSRRNRGGNSELDRVSRTETHPGTGPHKGRRTLRRSAPPRRC